MRLSTGLCGLLLLASASAGATDMYKWKDANGVTHYSETPPPGQRFESRRMDGSDPVQPETKTAAAESPQCTTARQNLSLLGSSKKVLQDTDGDGKGDTPLDDSQRDAQRNLAEAAVRAYCPPAGT